MNKLQNLFNKRTNFSFHYFKIRKIILYRCLILCIIFGFLYYLYGNGKTLSDYHSVFDIDLYRAYENYFNITPNNDNINLNLLDPINLDKSNFIFVPLNTCTNNLMHNHTHANQKQILYEPYLLIFVKSEVTSFEIRQTIRQTWGNLTNSNYSVRLLFMLGYPESKQFEIQNRIKEESFVYKDIVQVDVVENYYNITYKFMGTLKFIIKYCYKAKYLAFVDQDVLVHLKNVFKHLVTISQTQYSVYVAGYVLYYVYPIRFYFNKWYISYSDYQFNLYPPFPIGAFILMSMPVVEYLYVGFMYTKLLPFEDVMIGLILYKLGLTPIHLNNVHLSKNLKFFNNILAVHGYHDPSLQKIGWNLINS